jgi:HK97 family phage major capsid protein
MSKKEKEIELEEKDLDEEEAEDEVDEEEAGEDEEGIDEKGLQSLIQKQVKDIFERESTAMAEKYASKIKEMRKGILQNKEVKNTEVSKEDKIANFFKALISGDTKALTTSSGDTPKAGYLIPTEFLAEVLRTMHDEYGVARRDMRYLPFSGPSNTRTIPKLGTSVSVAWTNEAAAKTSTQPLFALVTQTLKKLAAIVPLTEELFEDSAISIIPLLTELFAEALAKEEDTQFFAGTGSPWTGILSNSSVQAVTLAGGETFADLNADDLLDMTAKVAPSMRRNAKFYMSTTIFNLIKKLKTSSTLDYIYEKPGGQDAPNGKVWGYPVEIVDVMPALTDTAANKAFVIFGDLKKTCIFGDKQQMRVRVLEEATITDTDGTTPINLAEQDMIALRIVERVGYVCALPEQICVCKTAAGT